jgi:hypothetical protein
LLDYVAAVALIVLPFVLGFRGAELWLSVAGGAGLITYSLMTDYAFGAVRLISFNLHLLLDLAAGAAFIVAPFALRFGTLASIYYPVMAVGVMAVVALSVRDRASVAAANA